MKKWLLDRLKEKSTWKGLSVLAGLFGVMIAPDQFELIGAAVITLVGLRDSFRQEVA